MNYLLRQATYADKPAIFEFLRAAYAGRSEFKFPHRWEWAFERNPYLRGDAPPVWIALAPDGRVIGQSAALVEPLVVDGQEYRVGWGVDFFVLPEYRGQGIGTKLQEANNAGNELFMSLSMAGSAAAIKTRLGLEPQPAVYSATRILHHDPESVARTLKARAPFLPFAGSLAPLIARVLTRRDAPKKPSNFPQGLEIRQETAFTEAFDHLWKTLAPAYRVLVRRDAPYLTWKFRDQPHMQHEVVGGYREGRLAGYLILRRARPPERNSGILVDLFAHPEDRSLIAALVDFAIARFYHQGVTTMVAATSVPEIRKVLVSRKFKQGKTLHPLARAPLTLPDSGWLLSKGDHDWDQYPLA